MTLLTGVLFLLGVALLIGGAEVLVRGATRIATAFGISPLVIGLTVVAFGTSAPELAVSTAATLGGNAGIALGNVVGSNVLNVLLILGVSAVLAPLVVQRRVIRLEVPFMIGISVLVVLLALNGLISRWEGLFLLTSGIAYTTALVLRARAVAPPRPHDVPPPSTGALVKDGILVLVGLGLLVLGSRWIVDGARAMAASLGVPDLVIGLTIVATGTSLPELATSVVAAFRGERDIAVGNIIGSNIFNLLIILGAAAAVAPAGIPVPLSALTFDLPVMLAVSVACLPIFFTGSRVDRLEGVIFLGFYVSYTVYLVLDASNHHALDALQDALFLFAIPLSLVVLAASVLRQWTDR
jgi:cation:H+ antiporter